MSFILVPNVGEDVQVNAWNCPTLEYLRAEHILTDEHAEILGYHGCGAQVNAGLAVRIAAAIQNKLSTMTPADRIRGDLTATSVPKVRQTFEVDGTGNIDAIELYSATYEWLVMFRDFCKRCNGFMVSWFLKSD